MSEGGSACDCLQGGLPLVVLLISQLDKGSCSSTNLGVWLLDASVQHCTFRVDLHHLLQLSGLNCSFSSGADPSGIVLSSIKNIVIWDLCEAIAVLDACSRSCRLPIAHIGLGFAAVSFTK